MLQVVSSKKEERAPTRIERGHIVSTKGSGNSDGNMSLTTELEGSEIATVARRDFFSVFYLPTNQAYDEEVRFTSSSYSAPFQGAASAVMGGILSVLDTALAVMNEFDNPSDSINSCTCDSTKDEDEDGLRGNVTCCASSERNSRGCCKKAARSHVSERTATQGIQNGAQDNDDLAPDISLIGSISMLQVLEEDPGDSTETLLSGLHSESMNDMQTETNADADTKSRDRLDSEYCIIGNENETRDGWLVVCDD